MKRDTSFGKKMNSTLPNVFPFLQKVMATYPTGKLALLGQCPDSSCKAASAVSGSAKKSAYFLCTCPYSPQLNIVEGLWKWLKSSVINNVFCSAVSKSVCVSGNLWMKS
ncbi:transposase [Paenibacillus larvae]|nr:transposase [Paenibacillus larvae]MDT2240976.1 transposase [Paenibacillus larvae]